MLKTKIISVITALTTVVSILPPQASAAESAYLPAQMEYLDAGRSRLR